MTLILNEIHILNGLDSVLMVAAADRRITSDGAYHSSRRKVFRIPYLNGAISYFGIAQIGPPSSPKFLSDFLPDFIRKNSSAASLGEFAQTLHAQMSVLVAQSVLAKHPSGFHICGYDYQGLPDFWYMSNIGGIQDFQYVGLKPRYDPPSSHFLGRDASNQFQWDGKDPHSAKNGVQIYRNGDYRAHVAAWEALDGILGSLLQFPDFDPPHSPKEYGVYVKFKFEFIAYVYGRWAKKKIIAKPIDVIVLEAPSTIV